MSNRSGVIDVETDPEGLDFVTPDGRRFADVLLTLTPEAVAKLCTGYRCIYCHEEWETGAWPKHCPVCNYPVGSQQREDFEGQFKGALEIPSGVTADEIAKSEEEFERSLRERR